MLNKNFYLILIISLVFAISFWIGFNVNLLPAEASINAPIYDELFKILFIIGLIIFIGMTIAVIYSLFKFRKRNDQIGDGIALEGNLSLEIVWTIIPSIIVLLIGLYSYNIYDRMGGMKELNHNHEMMSSNSEKIWAGISQTSDNEIAINNLSIEVSAMQFAFLFNYPKGNFISGELHVHKGTIETAYTIMNGEYEVIEAEIIETSELINKELKNSNLPEEIRIGAVLRDNKVIIPRSDFVFQKDDKVVFLAKKDSISVVENIFRISSI